MAEIFSHLLLACEVYLIISIDEFLSIVHAYKNAPFAALDVSVDIHEAIRLSHPISAIHSVTQN